jgi:hypothetical protein
MGQPHRALRGSAFAPAASRLLRTPPIPCASQRYALLPCAGNVHDTLDLLRRLSLSRTRQK